MPGLATERILLIDSYDSFSYNLADLLRNAIPHSEIYIIKNDAITIKDLLSHLQYYSAVVVGPGPGSPSNKQDIGIINDLWNISEELMVPIFGVCLGLQSLALESGYSLSKLDVVKHGQISVLEHVSHDLFHDIGDIKVVRYHSLHVTRPKQSTGGVANIEELAWSRDENGTVVMALRHIFKPFWAVQYHPESICTAGGLEVIRNFWTLSRKWSQTHRPNAIWSPTHALGQCWPSNIYPNTQSVSLASTSQVFFKAVSGLDISPTEIYDLLGNPSHDDTCALLDSAANPGRFSIVACSTQLAPQISYSRGDDSVTLKSLETNEQHPLNGITVWDWLQRFIHEHRASGGSQAIPFWGGLIGFVSYNVALETLHVALDHETPIKSLQFLFVERSVVHDNHTGTAYVQSIKPFDDCWVEETALFLSSRKHRSRDPPCNPAQSFGALSISMPDKQTYLTNISKAKQYLSTGDSYEICLTARTRVRLPSLDSSESRRRSWMIYKRTRACNPAPYASYLRIGGITLVSSSPERFLSFSRQGLYQMRPIKGTAAKEVCQTREDAETALSTPKEFAENLMIVDLIRHDLFQSTRGRVLVPKLCVVEEYRTVWQLVSVVESGADSFRGAQILGSCLPPGSMTGAPKKRSCEILNKLESDGRGLYSGVCGYFDVGGGGDFSVIIRSSIHEDSMQNGDCEMWEIGAGGAITALSDPEGEWEEMLIKLQSVLKVFGTK